MGPENLMNQTKTDLELKPHLLNQMRVLKFNDVTLSDKILKADVDLIHKRNKMSFRLMKKPHIETWRL